MIFWRGLPGWLFRAWPALALLPVFTFHVGALTLFADKAPMVNKFAGIALQVVGGLLILYSIDQNLGLFTKQSLTKKFVGWIRSFPVKRKTVVLCATGTASGSSSATASISIRKAPTTIEERVAELERTLKEHQTHTQTQIAAVHERIDSESNQLSGRIDETTTRIGELTQQVHESVVGGFKLQAFGVLLAVYGAITSVYA